MAYIDKDDFKIKIKIENLDRILQNDNSVLNAAIAEAQTRVESYLFDRYDTETIFGRTGDERHPTIINHMVSIALYNLHQRLPGRMSDTDTLLEDYQDALDDLKAVSKGKMAYNLPRQKEDSRAKTRVRFGSEEKRRRLGINR